MTAAAYAEGPRPLLVPCTEGAAHAFNRPADCPTCHGSGHRPADDTEVLYCDNGHEVELRTDADEPELDGAAPMYDTRDGVAFGCPWRGCGDVLIFTRAGA